MSCVPTPAAQHLQLHARARDHVVVHTVHVTPVASYTRPSSFARRIKQRLRCSEIMQKSTSRCVHTPILSLSVRAKPTNHHHHCTFDTDTACSRLLAVQSKVAHVHTRTHTFGSRETHPSNDPRNERLTRRTRARTHTCTRSHATPIAVPVVSETHMNAQTFESGKADLRVVVARGGTAGLTLDRLRV